MDWQWIDIELAIAIHDRQLSEHGGLAGVRDVNLLDSALARAKHLQAYGEESVFVLAAAYGYGIARNHPFMDGNKRTAYVCSRLFLKLHGEDMSDTPERRVSVFERIAGGDIVEGDFAKWLESGCID